jgi:hypothetical protein
MNRLDFQRIRKQDTQVFFILKISHLQRMVKLCRFASYCTDIDGNKKINGRKRHIVTDTLRLVWLKVE